MSAQNTSARPEAPYRKVPKTVRVPSGSQATPTSVSQTTRFYDGPTVPASAANAYEPVAEAAKTRASPRPARRRPWSLISLLTSIPLLIVVSLVSTIACPPPAQTKSSLSHFVLSPFGLHDGSSQHSQLHQTLCYPANVYHAQVLQPYVYPVINDLKFRVTSHPAYTAVAVPAQAQTRRVTAFAAPIVDRIHRGIRRIHLTFVQPHIPYLKARIRALTAPYTSRASALYRTYLAPHVQTATKYAQVASKHVVDTFHWTASHPATGKASRYAQQGYLLSRATGQQVYAYSRPHAIRLGKEADRVAREIIGPNAVDAIKWAIVKAQLGANEAKTCVSAAYTAHLEPHVGPYLVKARTVIAPYTSAFTTKVYRPFIRPVLVAILPPAVIPQPPKTFWDLIADILPGSRIGEHRADLSYTEKARDEKAKATVGTTRSAKVFDRAEMNRIFASTKSLIESEGKKGYARVRQELVDYNTDILSDEKLFPALKTNARAEVDRDIDYLMKGLDKLYTKSTVLTRDQVGQSSKQAEARVSKKIREVKDRAQKVRETWKSKSASVVRNTVTDFEKSLGDDWATLSEKMAWLDDITPKDWAAYNSLIDSRDAWVEKFKALHSGESKDRALNAPSANINRAVVALNTELDDVFEVFRDMVRTLTQTALNRIEAREAVAADSASSIAKAASKSAAQGRVSILPIVEDAAAAEAAGAIIGKGKEQVVEALNQAAAAGETVTVVDRASSAVHDATRAVTDAKSIVASGVSAIFSTVSSAVSVAADSVASVTSSVGAISSASDRIASLAAAESASIESAASAASVAVHEATLAPNKAAGSVYTEAAASLNSATRAASLDGAVPTEAADEYVEVDRARRDEL